MLLNAAIYERNPLQHELANNGVAQVERKQDEDRQAYERTLRFELQNFVCDGEYLQGLERLLQSFLDRLRAGEQPAAVWLSGFYGAGKSHLAKMAGVLWVNYKFQDGATAISLATFLPTSLKDLLRELHQESHKTGGLHLASGLLGTDESGTALGAVLSIVFKSKGLPAQLSRGRFVLWLKESDYYDKVVQHIDAAGETLEHALYNFAASPSIRRALLACDPGLGDEAKVRELLREQFVLDNKMSADRFVEEVQRVLKLGSKELPLTLLVLDEVQQYINNDSGRSLQVQQVVELCQSHFKGRVQVLATGQSAMGSTDELEKLKGRFPLTIHLTDADVEGVIRKTVLQKNLKHQPAVKAILDAASGEVSRHLHGSRIAASATDERDMVGDYPILPTRRRFYEAVLRAVDATGVVSQLRNQLRIAYEAAKKTANESVGNVIGGDYIFDELQTSSSFPNLISNAMLSSIRRLESSNVPDDQLKARLMKLVFLINRLPTDAATGLGVRADANTLADLLVTDLTADSSELRAQVPKLLQELQDQQNLLMALEEGGRTVYRENTAESASWYAEFKKFDSEMRSSGARMGTKRNELLRAQLSKAFARVKAVQGQLNVARKLEANYEANCPAASDKQLTLWVQDGWQTTYKAVETAAQAAGVDSATVFLFVPERDKADLNDAIVEMRAAAETIHARGVPSTPEGQDARKMMERRQATALERIDDILGRALEDAVVLCGGGAAVEGNDLVEKLQNAVNQALPRLFYKFAAADHKDWGKVLDKASDGTVDALKLVGHTGDVAAHPLAKELMAFIGAAGKKGADLQEKYEAAPYGWPRDAVQGVTYTLLANALIKASDAAGNPLTAKQLPRQQFTKATFKTEQSFVSGKDRLAVGAVLSRAGIKYGAGEEAAKAPLLPAALRTKRDAAGGDAPLPELPELTLITDIEKVSGNDQMLAIAASKDELLKAIEKWDSAAAKIESRKPAWTTLLDLLEHTAPLPDATAWSEEKAQVEAQRALLASPDPVATLSAKVLDGLRRGLNDAAQAYAEEYAAELAALEQDAAWLALSPQQRDSLLANAQIPAGYSLEIGSASAVLAELKSCDLLRWADRTAALGKRFEALRQAAIKLLAPTAVKVALPRRLLKTPEDVHAWLQEVETTLLSSLQTGPVQL